MVVNLLHQFLARQIMLPAASNIAFVFGQPAAATPPTTRLPDILSSVYSRNHSLCIIFCLSFDLAFCRCVSVPFDDTSVALLVLHHPLYIYISPSFASCWCFFFGFGKTSLFPPTETLMKVLNATWGNSRVLFHFIFAVCSSWMYLASLVENKEQRQRVCLAIVHAKSKSTQKSFCLRYVALRQHHLERRGVGGVKRKLIDMRIILIVMSKQ